MSAAAALLSLCFSALAPCPATLSSACVAQVALNFVEGRTVHVSSDDTLIAVVANDGLHVYNLLTGDEVSLPAHLSNTHRAVSGVAFSPDVSTIAVAMPAATAAFDLSTGRELWADTATATLVAYSPDGKRVATVHDSTSVLQIRDAATGSLLLGTTVAVPQGGQLVALDFIAGGDKILTSTAGEVLVLDAATGNVLHLIEPGYMFVTVAVSPDKKYFAIVAPSVTKLTVYKTADYSVHQTIEHGALVFTVSFSGDSEYMTVGGSNPDLTTYAVSPGTDVATYTTDMEFIIAARFLHHTHRFVTTSWTDPGALLLWDPSRTFAPPTAVPTEAPPTPAPAVPAPAPVRGHVQLVSASGARDVAGVPVVGPEVSLPAGGIALSSVAAVLQGAASAHAARVAVGEKLRLSCASGSCEFVVAVYSCMRCADASNDFESQLVADGFTPGSCAPAFSVQGRGHHAMRTFRGTVLSSDPLVLNAVVHATEHAVVFAADASLPQQWCPPRVFRGPSTPCKCVRP